MTNETQRLTLWSSGGGVQSTAIAVLILQGKLPIPDLAVIADTGREKQATWDYFNSYTQPILLGFGCPVFRIHKDNFDAPDLTAKGSTNILMPMFTNHTGTLRKLPTYCSTEWKQRPVRRFANFLFPGSLWTVWMGMSYDEPKRIRPTLGKWQSHYPLFEMKLTRDTCIQLVKDHGWPEPPRSSCWMCPNMSLEQWRSLPQNELAQAAQLEAQIREDDPSLFLHQHGKPILQAVHDSTDNQPNLFQTDRCDGGHCFI